MSFDVIYAAINGGVMPAWALLILAPRWRVTRKLVHSFLYPFLYGGLYIAFLLTAIVFGQSADDAGMSSIAGVSALFSAPVGVLTGWTHYLVFDLFVGAWISRDAISRGIAHWKVIPTLFFTFIFGPTGLFLYGLLRLASGQGGLISENDARKPTVS